MSGMPARHMIQVSDGTLQRLRRLADALGSESLDEALATCLDMAEEVAAAQAQRDTAGRTDAVADPQVWEGAVWDSAADA